MRNLWDEVARLMGEGRRASRRRGSILFSSLDSFRPTKNSIPWILRCCEQEVNRVKSIDVTEKRTSLASASFHRGNAAYEKLAWILVFPYQEDERFQVDGRHNVAD